jgi:hypothetical protein
MDLSEVDWVDTPLDALKFAIFQSDPSMKSLNLAQCTTISDEILHQWLTKCNSLESLGNFPVSS